MAGADGSLRELGPPLVTGYKPVYPLRTAAGFSLRCTGDHRILTANRGDVPANELTTDDEIVLGVPSFGTQSLDVRVGELLGLAIGDGYMTKGQENVLVTLAPSEREVAEHVHAGVTSYREEHAVDGRGRRESGIHKPQGTVRFGTSPRCVVDELKRYSILNEGSAGKRLTPEAFGLERESGAAVLRGPVTGAGPGAAACGRLKRPSNAAGPFSAG